MKNKIFTIHSKLAAFVSLLLIGTLNTVMADNTVEITGGCVNGTAVLTEVGTNDGKIAYTGVGSIFSVSDTQFAIWWDATESKWFLALDGQPYWYSSDNTTLPNSTLLSGNWTQSELSAGTCDVVIQGTGTNMPPATALNSTEEENATVYSKDKIVLVRLLSYDDNATISVYSFSGTKIKELQTSSRETQITGLEKGAYMFKVMSVKGTETYKLVVE